MVIDRFEQLYNELRQELEDIAFPEGDPRRGWRTKDEIIAEIKRKISRTV